MEGGSRSAELGGGVRMTPEADSQEREREREKGQIAQKVWER